MQWLSFHTQAGLNSISRTSSIAIFPDYFSISSDSPLLHSSTPRLCPRTWTAFSIAQLNKAPTYSYLPTAYCLGGVEGRWILLKLYLKQEKLLRNYQIEEQRAAGWMASLLLFPPPPPPPPPTPSSFFCSFLCWPYSCINNSTITMRICLNMHVCEAIYYRWGKNVARKFVCEKLFLNKSFLLLFACQRTIETEKDICVLGTAKNKKGWQKKLSSTILSELLLLLPFQSNAECERGPHPCLSWKLSKTNDQAPRTKDQSKTKLHKPKTLKLLHINKL